MSFMTPRWLTYATVTNISHLKNYKAGGVANDI